MLHFSTTGIISDGPIHRSRLADLDGRSLSAEFLKCSTELQARPSAKHRFYSSKLAHLHNQWEASSVTFDLLHM
jgi:hypothetical protein